VGDIASQLEPSGLSRGEAQEVGQEIARALGPAPGEIRLILDLESDGEVTKLITLEATRSDGTGLMLHRESNGALTAKPLTGTLTRRLTVVRGEIDSNSFYTSAVTAG
jgi:hypothetical protein